MERSLYLIRHGSVEFPEGKRRCIGRTDLPLSEAGRRQARELAAYFSAHPVEAVYASPLKRTRETAEILAGNRFPVFFEEKLMELDMGEWENVPLKEIKKELESEPRQGEKRSDGLSRFAGAIREILGKTRGDVAVVAHAGINCCYLSSLLHTPLETSRGLPQPYGGFSRILVREPEGDESKTSGTGGFRLQVLELGRMPGEAPTPEECERIWDRYQTPENVREHCRAVEQQAAVLVHALLESGQPLSLALVQAGALLHDVARTEKDHPAAGARILIREGYPRLADLVLRHHDWNRTDSGENELEAAVVYLADKQIQGTRVVSLAERFAESRRRCEAQADAEEALTALEKRYRQAKSIEETLMKKQNQFTWRG